MIHLIGGPPGGGKTTLGIALAQKSGIQSFTIDDIRTSLLATTSPESHPALHVVGLPDPWTYFTKTSPDLMVEHATAQHTALWPPVLRVIRKRLTTQPVVIDGWHLMPDLIAGADLEQVNPVWLDVDHDILEGRERQVWDFYAKSPDPELMFSNFLARSTTWNDRMRDEALNHGFRTIKQDGSKSVADLVEEVLS